MVARMVASEVVLMKTVDSRKLDALKDFIEGGGGEWEGRGKWRGMVVKEDQGELEPIIHTIHYLISIHCRVSVFASCGYSVSELGAIR